MIIRRANNKDVEKILQLLIQVGNIHAELRPDLFVKDKTKYGEKELLDVISNDLKPVFVYINDEEDLCGYAFCVLSEINGNNLVSHKSIYIDDICVNETHRCEGVGRSLYEYVIQYAKRIGCYNVTLNVWNGNSDAIKFYEKCGFKTQKTVLEQIL